MILKVSELIPGKLRSLPLSSGYGEIRQDSILCFYTKLHELDAFVANLYSPWGHVFYNFGAYPSAEAILHETVRQLETNDLKARLDTLLNNHALGVETGVPHCLLMPLTSGYADEYFPTWLDYEFAAMGAGRHFATCGRLENLENVLSYLEGLLAVFGNSSVTAFPEGSKMVVERDWYERDAHYLYLGKPLCALSRLEQEQCIEFFGGLNDSGASSIVNELDPLYGLTPAISLYLSTEPSMDADVRRQLHQVQIGRARVAIPCASRTVLCEHLYLSLEFDRYIPGSGKMRDEIIEMILSELAKTPIVFQKAGNEV